MQSLSDIAYDPGVQATFLAIKKALRNIDPNAHP